MTSEEPSRLGIHHLLTDADVRDSGERRGSFALEVKFNGLLKVDDRFLAARAEAGHVHVKALRDVKLVLAIEAVSDLFHCRKNIMPNQQGQRNRFLFSLLPCSINLIHKQYASATFPSRSLL